MYTSLPAASQAAWLLQALLPAPPPAQHTVGLVHVEPPHAMAPVPGLLVPLLLLLLELLPPPTGLAQDDAATHWNVLTPVVVTMQQTSEDAQVTLPHETPLPPPAVLVELPPIRLVLLVFVDEVDRLLLGTGVPASSFTTRVVDPPPHPAAAATMVDSRTL